MLMSNKSSLIMDVSQTTLPEDKSLQEGYSPNPIVIINMDQEKKKHQRRWDSNSLPIHKAAERAAHR
jgi:hypothetical protein